MSFINAIISSWSPHGETSSITKFLSHNNTPVNNFCSTIPITQPSLVSTTFGQSLLSLLVLVIYLVLYRLQGARTGIESRLLISLIVGNVLFTMLAFNDWFNLTYQVILCNDYKNGITNLYQVSELLETYRLYNLMRLYFEKLDKYASLVYKQFTAAIFDSTKEVVELIKNYKNQA